MESGETEEDYRRFILKFCKDLDCLSVDDHGGNVPFRLSSNYLVPSEIEGECLEWIRHYLSMHNCPSSLLPQLSRAVFSRFHDSLRLSDFFVQEQHQSTNNSNRSASSKEDSFENMSTPELDASQVLGKVIDHIHETLRLWNQSPPAFVENSSHLIVSSHAIKNTRRKMEDKHVVIKDLNTLYDLKGVPPQSYFAVFDGHGGLDAATYAATHLHGHMLADNVFSSDPAAAMKQAYKITDLKFLEKAKRENLLSGTTGLSVLIRGSEIYLGWLGDSQAIIVREGQPVKIMDPHKPEREDEKKRIEDLGGCVIFIGVWRVNGNVAVSRAIGDAIHKPFISSDADVTSIQLTGEDEYLVLACDGLWDVLNPMQVAHLVYDHVQSGSISNVANSLVNAARENGSVDNISVIVIFFKTSLCEPGSMDSSNLQVGLNQLSEAQHDHFQSPSSHNSAASVGNKDRVRVHKESPAQDDIGRHQSSLSRSLNVYRSSTQQQSWNTYCLTQQCKFSSGQSACCYLSPEIWKRKVETKI